MKVTAIRARNPRRRYVTGVGDFQPSASIIADSVTPWNHRLTTAVLTMHRFMLPELNAHRNPSRNSASSRAIPVRRTMQAVTDTPALPLRWPMEQPGMQGGADLPADTAARCRQDWLDARDAMLATARRLTERGLHKSVVNRLLEPFATHTVVISANTFDNFFNQRCSPLAQDEIRVLAEALRAAVTASTPTPVPSGGWHLPFITPAELHQHGPWLSRRLSVARCARVSYLTHDGTRDPQQDLALFDKLLHADPPHASPFEHVATPLNPRTKLREGNFVGWRQLRHMLIKEKP